MQNKFEFNYHVIVMLKNYTHKCFRAIFFFVFDAMFKPFRKFKMAAHVLMNVCSKLTNFVRTIRT